MPVTGNHSAAVIAAVMSAAAISMASSRKKS